MHTCASPSAERGTHYICIYTHIYVQKHTYMHTLAATHLCQTPVLYTAQRNTRASCLSTTPKCPKLRMRVKNKTSERGENRIFAYNDPQTAHAHEGKKRYHRRKNKEKKVSCPGATPAHDGHVKKKMKERKKFAEKNVKPARFG